MTRIPLPASFAAVVMSLPVLAQADAPATPRLPAEFVHDRIHLRADVHGEPVRFYTDTGGGWNAIAGHVVAKAGLAASEVTVDGKPARVIDFAALDIAPIPAPSKWFMDGGLVVAAAGELDDGGFLGGRWFADRIWEIDYPARTMRVLATHAAAGDPSCIDLGFQADGEGRRTMHFPSMDFRVDGETLAALLDTGATMTVAAKAAAPFGLAEGTRVGTSFIERSVFERWQAAHPGWRVVESADAIRGTYFRAIEVPEIEIAGQRAGPVWFTERPDGVFQQYMTSMMDRPVWGALGGSAFRHFRIVIDYPAARGCFYRSEK